tara:strand:- start:575 stop:1012 length:438 start_codon:yes stop_codon:yes gene_type:complete
MASQRSTQEKLLEAIMDRMIPAVGDLPSAGQMGLTAEIVQLAAKQKRFEDLFNSATEAFESSRPYFLTSSSSVQDENLKTFESNNPDLFNTIRTIVYIVYYKDPRVHTRIDWNGRAPQPQGYEMDPWDESVLVNARKREPFWRKV